MSLIPKQCAKCFMHDCICKPEARPDLSKTQKGLLDAINEFSQPAKAQAPGARESMKTIIATLEGPGGWNIAAIKIKGLVEAYEALERELAEAKSKRLSEVRYDLMAALEKARAELLTCKGDLACALTDLSDARAELAEAKAESAHNFEAAEKWQEAALDQQAHANEIEDKSTALVEALERIAGIRCAWQLSQEIAREALAKHKGSE